MAQRFFTKHAGTELHFEGVNSYCYCTIADCETEEEFTEWQENSEPETAAEFDGEVYLKLKNSEGHWEAVTLAEANESINDSE